MAQQVINNGTYDNDPGADTLRDAFAKANANFTELYTAANNKGRVVNLGILTGDSEVTVFNVAAKMNLVTTTIGADESPVLVRAIKLLPNLYGQTVWFLWLGGKGVWGAGEGSTPVTANHFFELPTVPATPEDIENASNAVYDDLGVIVFSDFLTLANEEQHDFTDESYFYFFVYTIAGVDYVVRFIGTPGVYGDGGTLFTLDDFSDTTNSEVTPALDIEGVLLLGNLSVTSWLAKDAETGGILERHGHGEGYTQDELTTKVLYAPPIANVTHTIPAKPANDVFAMVSDLNQSGATFEQFGAVGDGVADDWQAITDALASGYKKVIGDKDYKISRPVIVPSGKIIEINGTVKIQDGFEDTLLSDLEVGATTIQVTDAESKYFPGQQVCVSADNLPLQGGGTGQTRRVAPAFTIASVSGNTITFTNAFEPGNVAVAIPLTVANNARVGHCQSVLLAESVGSTLIYGKGKTDANKANQYDIEPVTSTGSYAEDVRFGCGITVNDCYKVNVMGIESVNAVLHNFQYKNSTYFDASFIIGDAAHDKGFLMWYCSNFNVVNSSFLNSDWEDGIIAHNNCENGFLSNIYTENCSRTGVYISSNNTRIIVNGGVAKNCGRAFQTQNSSNITVKAFKAIGGGKDRYLETSRPIYTLTNIKDSSFEFSYESHVDEFDAFVDVFAATGISIVGGCDGVSVNGLLRGLKDSTGTGIGISLGTASGNTPKNIDLTGVSVINCKTGIKLDAGCENIRLINSFFDDNTTTIDNAAGNELKIFNTTGIAQNNVTGSLTIREQSTGGIAAEITQEGYLGQPSLASKRALGSMAAPTAIPVNNGLFRQRVSGYNGTAFSTLYQWLGIVATENWTPTGNGHKISYRAVKNGTTTQNQVLDILYDGLSINEPALESLANLNVKALAAQTKPIFRAAKSDGTAALVINADGSIPGLTRTLVCDTTDSATITGVTDVVITKSFLIPANTLSDGVLSFISTFKKIGAAGKGSYRAYINTTNSTTGAAIVAFHDPPSAGRYYVDFRRDFSIKNGGTLLFGAGALFNDANAFTSSVVEPTETAIDTTQNLYILLTGKLESGLDSIIQKSLEVSFKKSTI